MSVLLVCNGNPLIVLFAAQMANIKVHTVV
jgi:hypothetical protein